MKRNYLLLILTALTLYSLPVQSQYETPGTGVHWNLDSLLINSGGVVSYGDDELAIFGDLTISEEDTLSLLVEMECAVVADALITIEGVAYVGSDISPVTFFGTESSIWGGLRIEENAEAIFNNTTFTYGGGIKCISGDVQFTACTIDLQENLATNSAALEFFNGSPFVTDCTFESNAGAAISSPANIGCAPQISSSMFLANNTENSNRPQINLGPSGAGQIAYIIDNTIIGSPDFDQAGGIAVSSIFGDPCEVLIQGNLIETNRYGIALAGGSVSAQISGNDIIDNDTQGEPLLGGSGINLNGTASSSAIVHDNYISGNLWGITVQGEFEVNMGDLDDTMPPSPGNNTFNENGNGGETHALYNNTPSPISAMNNCWIEGQESTAENVEGVIFHSVDDGSLGNVDFSEFQCGIVDGLMENELLPLRVYPNPTNGLTRLDLSQVGLIHSAVLVDQTGRSIGLDLQVVNNYEIDLSRMDSGVYRLLINSDGGRFVAKLIKN